MATITEDYVSFETAKLLKEKGFDEATNRYYNAQHDQIRTVSDTFLWHWNNEKFMKRVSMDGAIAIPTLQMAMKWLREVHNIDIFPWKIGKGIYSCAIFNSNTGQDLSSNKDFPSEKYEETVDEAIRYCLENLI